MGNYCTQCTIKESKIEELRNEKDMWRQKYTDLLYKALEVDSEYVQRYEHESHDINTCR
jgi:hypothetical protein